jgi:RimJ/RimL family protein N-acetyltransferase
MFNLNIKTDRIILRPYRFSDAPRLTALANDFDVAKMLTTLPHPYAENDATTWIGMHERARATGKGYPFAVEIDGAVAGTVDIGATDKGEYDLGYWLGQAYWGHGYATEAVKAMLEFAFSWLALPYVRAGFITGNTASGRVLEKTGFLATHRYQKFHAVRGAEVEVTRLILPRNAFTRDDQATEQVYKAA